MTSSSPDSLAVRKAAASAPSADLIISRPSPNRSSSELVVTAVSAAELNSDHHRATGPAPGRVACSAATKRWSSTPGSGVSWNFE